MPTLPISACTAVTVTLVSLWSLPGASPEVSAADWPMWRRDAGRTAESPEALPHDLREQWTHELPAPAPAFRAKRLRFDEGLEPVVAGGKVFVCSASNDSVVALDLGVRLSGPLRARRPDLLVEQEHGV